MADWTKHRETRDLFEIDFAETLTAGEALTGFDIRVYAREGLTLRDATAEFLSESPTLGSSGYAAFFLEEADSEADQAEGEYVVLGKATTTRGRICPALVSLEVLAAG